MRIERFQREHLYQPECGPATGGAVSASPAGPPAGTVKGRGSGFLNLKIKFKLPVTRTEQDAKFGRGPKASPSSPMTRRMLGPGLTPNHRDRGASPSGIGREPGPAPSESAAPAIPAPAGPGPGDQ